MHGASRLHSFVGDSYFGTLEYEIVHNLSISLSVTYHEHLLHVRVARRTQQHDVVLYTTAMYEYVYCTVVQVVLRVSVANDYSSYFGTRQHKVLRRYQCKVICIMCASRRVP